LIHMSQPACLSPCCCLFPYSRPLLLPLSFPTRRSSDLPDCQRDGHRRIPVVARPNAYREPIQVATGRSCSRECGRVRDCNSDQLDRKSTRLNSSHRTISYAVFCLKKKNHETKKYQ